MNDTTLQKAVELRNAIDKQKRLIAQFEQQMRQSALRIIFEGEFNSFTLHLNNKSCGGEVERYSPYNGVNDDGLSLIQETVLNRMQRVLDWLQEEYNNLK